MTLDEMEKSQDANGKWDVVAVYTSLCTCNNNKSLLLHSKCEYNHNIIVHYYRRVLDESRVAFTCYMAL